MENVDNFAQNRGNTLFLQVEKVETAVARDCFQRFTHSFQRYKVVIFFVKFAKFSRPIFAAATENFITNCDKHNPLGTPCAALVFG